MNHKQYVPKAIAVCPECKSKLALFHIIERRDTDFYMKDRITYYCGICENQLKPEDFFKIEEEKVEVSKMGIKNLTEAEEKEFYRLAEKMNGKEPEKKQDVKVKKPIYGQEYFFSNSHGWVECDTWRDRAVDNKRWELGNAFLIREKALFDVEKRKVEVELERYAKEHNGPIRSDSFYLLYNNEDGGKLDYDVWSVCKPQGGVQFASKQLVFDAIEAVGKDRILKYIFGVESENVE
jgi:hypothetical protein